MPQPSAKFSPLIKAFSFALKQLRLYSNEHPIARQSLEDFARAAEDFFGQNQKIVIGTLGQRLIVDGSMTDDKDVAAKDLVSMCRRVGVESFSVERGVSRDEILCLVKLMGTRGKDLEEQGGFRRVFDESGFRHVKLLAGTFKLVGDGVPESDAERSRAVSEEGAAETLLDGVTEAEESPLAVLLRNIRNASPLEALPAGEIRRRAADIVDCLGTGSREAAQEVVGQTNDGQKIEQVVRSLMRALAEGLAGFFAEELLDPARIFKKFSAELDKVFSERFQDPDELRALSQKIAGVLADGVDEMRIGMMTHACRSTSGDIKKMQRVANKILREPGTRERLEPEIAEALASQGVPDDAIRTLFEASAKKAGGKRRVSLSAEELEALRRKAALYEEIEKSDLEKKIQQLEIENKIMAQDKERVESVVRHIAEGLLVVDEAGRVVMMNPAAEKLLGVKLKEKIGQPVAEGLGSDYVVAMVGSKTGGGGDETPKKIELISQSEDTRRILQASSAVVENEDGQTVGMVAVLSDVTRQKEEEQMKTRFVANVSHELRTPLVAIQKSLALILAREVGEVNPEQERFLGIAGRNIERLSRLINDLLDISKLEAGRVTLKPKKTPVRELILHVISTVETWAKDKKISIVTDFPDAAAELEADPDKLIQVVTNLLGNAVKYTPEGGRITVELRGGVRDPEIWEGDCVDIAVRDTGIGIAPNDHKRIFDKFEQVSLVQPGGISSTGLGLAIAREIVRYHSGKIWVESDIGKGSRFVFRLPAAFRLHEETKSRLDV